MKFPLKIELFKSVPLGLISIVVVAALLRMPFLDRYPPSLYSDEIAQGYNAYSILKTGRDEHGVLFPVTLRSFGDWKPPLQTYLMIPTIILFGLNEWGIRLPSAILGTGTVLLMYFFAQEIFTQLDVFVNKTTRTKVALIASLLLALSPWHILQSRAAMLVGITLFFLIFGTIFFFKGLRKRHYFIISGIFLALSLYGYYGMRLSVPLLIFFLSLIFFDQIRKNLVLFTISGVISLVVLLPLMNAFMSNPNVLLGRVTSVSVFHDQGIRLRQKELLREDIDMSTQQAQFFHNKPYHYTIDIVRRFFHHLEGRFLFVKGDTHLPFQIPNMGVLYLIDGILILTGTINLIRTQAHLLKFLALFIAISIFPAALTFVTPATNRSFTLVIPVVLIVAIGMSTSLERFSKRWTIPVVAVLYGLHLAYFLFQYTIVLPRNYANFWHYGYKELYAHLKQEEDKYDSIYISSKGSVPYIFYLFYNQIDPALLKVSIRRNFRDDEFGFEHVDSIGKYEFIRKFDWYTDKETLLPNSLLVVTSTEEIEGNVQKMKDIYYPNSDIAFSVYKINHD